ncbi:MAG: flagellin [Nannocystaceae bacterium]
MRITQTHLHQLANTSVRNARERLIEAQQVAVSGAKVTKPSDDPALASRARLTRSLLAQSDSHQRNIDFGTLQLDRGEQALAAVSNVLVRAKELALAMATDTINGTQRTLAAGEINELRGAAIDLANTQIGEEYVFSHVNTTSPPVDSVGNFTYDADLHQSVRRAEVGPAAQAEVGASGSHAFAQRAADPSSVDVFAVLGDLVIDLNANDTDAIRASVDQLNTAMDQVIAERSRLGLRSNRLQTASESVQDTKTVYRKLESDLVDADAAEAFSYLNLAETGLQAALAVTARILGPSLLDSL